MKDHRLPLSLGELMWKSFISTYGPVLGVLSFLASIGAWSVSGGASVSIVWVVGVASAALIVISSLAHATVSAFRAAGRQLPAVRYASTPPPVYRDLTAILLLDASDLFAPDALISIYQLREQQYEVLVAVGRVLTIQENGLIQVGITANVEPGNDLVTRLLANDVTLLRTLVVKPTVPTYVLQQIGVES